jgi:hypothetical protein
LQEPDLRARLIAGGAATAATRYDETRLVAAVAGVYAELVPPE